MRTSADHLTRSGQACLAKCTTPASPLQARGGQAWLARCVDFRLASAIALVHNHRNTLTTWTRNAMGMSNPRLRKHVRLPLHDYRLPGYYFCTVCTAGRRSSLSNVVASEVRLTEIGRIVEQAWFDSPRHHEMVALDEMVIMPNHVHGIIVILSNEDGMPEDSDLQATFDTALARSSRRPQRGSLGTIIGSFKSASSRNANRLSRNPDTSLWQRNYFEHIIRDERSLDAIRAYIAGNPASWEHDRENPYRTPGTIHPVESIQASNR